ncbi:MFS transporter [Marinobacterium arenosum]|uniref:MFS transporter n=1 Tax=Marinobacterium arenosum TaxID=2862496 RepID=UPI001C98504F|nr:MFS transporter [Marinobacterium arenosum]MBY4677007.1 MFS transporter [Marinobacterium arenosum]
MSTTRLNPWWLVAAGALLLAYSMGVRQTTGLLLPDISNGLQLATAELSFGFAMQNLVWGAVAPLAGMLAERFGTVRILLAGALLYCLGLVVAALAQSGLLFFIGNALLIGIGVGATTFPIVLAAVGKRFPAHKRTLALGVASAGGSLGQFGYAKLLGELRPILDWSDIFQLFAASTVLAVALVWMLADERKPATTGQMGKSGPFDWRQIRMALRVREYQLLNIGFFVCGFHIAFFSVHMAGLVSFCGLPPSVASDSLATIGLVNVLGTILIGWAGDRWHKPWLLVLVYWLRACLIMMLLLLPKNDQLFLMFGALMGMLWLSTLPLTSGCVAQLFGTGNLASLFGIVMFSHQIGAFFGSWWGGLLFDWYGSYDLALVISAALGLLAAAVHLPMTPARFQAQQIQQAQLQPA